MNESVERYIVALTMATRNPPAELADWVEYGASPRGTIALDACARANAWLAGRDFVSPEDIQSVAHDVLRHRLILTFEADAQGITTNQVIDRLLESVPTP
jgi:MoxR-like ATPase